VQVWHNSCKFGTIYVCADRYCKNHDDRKHELCFIHWLEVQCCDCSLLNYWVAWVLGYIGVSSLHLVTSSLDKKYYRWLWRLPPFLFDYFRIKSNKWDNNTTKVRQKVLTSHLAISISKNFALRNVHPLLKIHFSYLSSYILVLIVYLL